MSLRIISADDRLREAQGKTTMALFGPSGAGKTTLLKTLPPAETLCIDLEAGLKSVQDWPGDSIPIRRFADAVDIACLIGGANPAAQPDEHFSEAHHAHLRAQHPELAEKIDTKRIIFVDSITDLTRQAMAWAKTRPEALSERTGKPDTRGAYGLLAREVIGLLKHLQQRLPRLRDGNQPRLCRCGRRTLAGRNRQGRHPRRRRPDLRTGEDRAAGRRRRRPH
jgi:hypothetical protein